MNGFNKMTIKLYVLRNFEILKVKDSLKCLKSSLLNHEIKNYKFHFYLNNCVKLKS